MRFLSRILLFCALASLLFQTPGFAQEALPFAEWFGNNQGTMVLHDPENDAYVIHNLSRANLPLSPHSTFKIPNSVIALETGVVSNTSTPVAWDKEKHPPDKTWTPALFKAWGRSHTMATAFQNSAIWYYQDVAENIGAKRMSQYLTQFKYGNQDISGGITTFWLNSSLKISAIEQIQFLERFYSNRLNVHPETIQLVKQIMVIDDTPTYRLSVKTGLGPIGNPHPLAWYVGFIEVKPSLKPYFFALNIQGGSETDVVARRKTIVLNTLKAMGLVKN